MLLPNEMVALAESRREVLEQEIRLQQLLAQAPRSPARWQQWTGGGLMWAGAMLVSWGEGMAASNRRRRVEVIS
jgi:hypothetical protein